MKFSIGPTLASSTFKHSLGLLMFKLNAFTRSKCMAAVIALMAV